MLRWPLSKGFKLRTCDEQRDLSWSLISEDGDHYKPNNNLVNSISSVIQRATDYGQAASGDDFRLYVTGYGQFFNDKDHGCDTVTFAISANPDNDGKPHNLLTTELRQDFNLMSITLNAAIKEAVDINSRRGVKYIDIDGLLYGHRFCEPGVKEPDQDNPNLWFFHYPYEEPADSSNPTIAYLNSVQQNNLNTLTFDPKTTLWTDYLNDFWSMVDETQFNQTVRDNVTAQFDIWPDLIGYQAKVFHPQEAFHKAIRDEIMKQYQADTASDSATNTTTAPSSTTATDLPTATSAPQTTFGSLDIISSSTYEGPTDPPPPYEWLFFQRNDEDENVNLCNDRETALANKTVPDEGDGAYEKYLGGTYTFDLDIGSCEYRNSGGNAGRLFCTSDDQVYPIECDWVGKDGYAVSEFAETCLGALRSLAVTCPYGQQ